MKKTSNKRDHGQLFGQTFLILANFLATKNLALVEETGKSRKPKNILEKPKIEILRNRNFPEKT